MTQRWSSSASALPTLPRCSRLATLVIRWDGGAKQPRPASSLWAGRPAPTAGVTPRSAAKKINRVWWSGISPNSPKVSKPVTCFSVVSSVTGGPEYAVQRRRRLPCFSPPRFSIARLLRQRAPTIPPFHPMPIGSDMAMKLITACLSSVLIPFGSPLICKPGEVLLAGFFCGSCSQSLPAPNVSCTAATRGRSLSCPPWRPSTPAPGRPGSSRVDRRHEPR